MTSYVLSIDQGTTSSRAIVFDADGHVIARHQQEHRQHYPKPGLVEHDAEEIWSAVLKVARDAMTTLGADADKVVAIGLTNQRETSVLWDAATGKPLGPAIVWQDRRTSDVCETLRAAGHEAAVRERTGLVLDPYFSATKIAWMLTHLPDCQKLLRAGRLRAGTIDSFLLWRLTGGKVHATDATNASRTLLYNIHGNDYDPWLLSLFGVPQEILPEVHDSAHAFGETDPALFGRAIAVNGIAGDQQAATVGQACFAPGMTKVTFGTGAFVVRNTGDKAVSSRHKLLTTIAYRLGGQTTYALEGSVFNAGSTVQWLRDNLGIIRAAAETEALAASLDDNRGVYIVPAFTGLGAPHWNAEARGLITGLTRDSGAAELARAALESVAYQTRDLLSAMAEDDGGESGAGMTLRADGGMTENGWFMQFLADLLGTPVDLPETAETTALGAAYLAGLGSGLHPDLDHIAENWRKSATVAPEMAAITRERLYGEWQRALARAVQG